MKKHSLLAFLVVAFLSLPFLGCHHHHHGGGGSVSPPSQNPAAYTYTATEVAHHQPGFFSCYWAGKLLLGTYQDYHNKNHCQLCELVGNSIKVRATFDGESIYNITLNAGENVFLPVEQGSLFTWPPVSKIHPRHLKMGHYWAEWTPVGWATTEKATITTDNKSQLWVYDRLVYQSSMQTWKEGRCLGKDMWLSVYFVDKQKKAGIMQVDLETEQVKYLYAQPGDYSVPGRNNDKIYYAITHGPSSTICIAPHQPIQEIPDIAWRFKKVGDAFFLLAAEHGWRKDGPSYLYVLNTSTGKFDLKLTIHDAEPWDITTAGVEGRYYLVTRNEHEGNLGRVYLIERK